VPENSKNLPTEIKRYHKLNKDQKYEIVMMLSQCYAINEIQLEIKERHGIELSYTAINNYAKVKKYQNAIKEGREKYLSDIYAVAGSHKRVRLDRAERLYLRSLKSGDSNTTLKSIEHQRKEIEGDGKSSGNVNLIFAQFNNMTDEDLIEKREELLKRIQNQQIKEIVDVQTPERR
jgi:hypothetical protein